MRGDHDMLRLRAMKMLRLAPIAFILAISSIGAHAQTSSTRAALQAQNNASIQNNTTGLITPSLLHGLLANMIASMPTMLDQNTFINTQTLSIPPIFTTLNGCLAGNLTSQITATGSFCGSGGGGGSPGGSTNSVQYNAGGGTFGGLALSASQLLIGSAGAPTTLTLGSGVSDALQIAANASGGFVKAPVANASLVNSTISGIPLGGNLLSLAFGAHLISGGSSYNGSTGVTITSDATNANTASTIVARDPSGNFSAGTITASLTGHASLDLPLAGGTLTGELTTAAATTSNSGLNLPQGSAPTSPVNGDLWITSSGLFARINGSTIGPFGTGGGSGCTVSGGLINQLLINNGSSGCSSNASAVANAGALSLGASGTPGSVAMGNATSGTVTLQPATGALGSVTLSLPAITDTLVTLTATQTLTNKTLTSPTLTTPALGTPASGVLTNATGLPISTGVSGLGANVATALGSALNGTGAVSATTSPAFVTPALGAATATSINGVTIPSASDTAVLLAATQTLTNKTLTSPTISGPTLSGTVAGNVTVSGNNTYSGVSTYSGSLVVGVRTITASGAVTVSATTDYLICVNKTSGAATTVNLPATPATGLTFLIKDCKGDAATNNITLTPAAGNIDGSSTYVMNTNYQSVAVTYSGSIWMLN
jgi:hypothetical protein